MLLPHPPPSMEVSCLRTVIADEICGLIERATGTELYLQSVQDPGAEKYLYDCWKLGALLPLTMQEI